MDLTAHIVEAEQRNSHWFPDKLVEGGCKDAATHHTLNITQWKGTQSAPQYTNKL